MSSDTLSLIPLWQLVFAAGVQAIVFIWFVATLAARVTAIETRNDKRDKENDARLARLEDKIDRILENYHQTRR